MASLYTTSARRQELTAQLFASADRICDCLDRITAGISTLKPIEFDRLMDDYRAEQIRYDRIEQELSEADKQTCLKEKQAKNLINNQKKRDKIHY